MDEAAVSGLSQAPAVSEVLLKEPLCSFRSVPSCCSRPLPFCPSALEHFCFSTVPGLGLEGS